MTIDALRSELETDPAGLGYAGKTVDEAYALLHEPQPYTVERETREPMSASGLFGLLSLESAGRVAVWPNLHLLYDAVQSQDRDRVKNWLNLLLAAGLVTSDERTTAIGVIEAAETVEETHYHEARVLHAFIGVAGMPNRIEPEDFAAAWAEVFG